MGIIDFAKNAISFEFNFLSIKWIMKSLWILFFLCFMIVESNAQENRWEITGKHEITWRIQSHDTAHNDQIEMSGKQVSAIITYGIHDEQELTLDKTLVFPMLRTIPNDTYGSMKWNIQKHPEARIKVNGEEVKERATHFIFNGLLLIRSQLDEGIILTHHLFPSTDKPAMIDRREIVNHTSQPISVTIPNLYWADTTVADQGVYGSYVLSIKTYHGGKFTLQPGGNRKYAIVYAARKITNPAYYYAARYEQRKREDLIDEIMGNLVLETPDSVINTMFSLAKLRATESIFDTKNGLMHSPGGGVYYAAIWANDEAEYVNPFFPFLGNPEGIASAINSFRIFAHYMNPEYRPIPSSIIAEGTDYWNGAGDRGDQAMIAYGASQFALAYGNRIVAQRLWPLISWCLEYLRRQKNKQGVILSDTDELEGRLPAGDANLSTNILTYGALRTASNLASALDMPEVGQLLLKEASTLKKNIAAYFEATVQGFKTYQYYKGNTQLRSWIGLPLTVGIFNRAKGTVNALFSPYLWTDNGMLAVSGASTYWDRELLYALQGTYFAGYTNKGTHYLHRYSVARLLGEHVPYAIEAWPEGDKRQLSAESGLYARVITEGLFGIRVKSFNSFQMKPLLPDSWSHMALKNVHILQRNFDIIVRKEGRGYRIIIRPEHGQVQKRVWNGHTPIEIHFLQ